MSDKERHSKARHPRQTARRPHNPQPPISTPQSLPAVPAAFWSAAVNLDAVEPCPEAPSTPVLPRLGPPPFPRGGFPLLGFLATVYEHVAKSAAAT